MILTVEDFDEATLFERLALDRVHPVLGDESIQCLDLRLPPQQGRELGGVKLRNTSSANGEDTLALALTPLFFGAAWKILRIIGDRPFAVIGGISSGLKSRERSCPYAFLAPGSGV